MTQLFTTLLTLSSQAGLVVLAILLLRGLLRRLPRRLCCLLWLLVAVRLLLPFQFSSSVSLQPQSDPITTLLQQEETASAPQPDASPEEGTAPDTSVSSPVTAPAPAEKSSFDPLPLLTGLWLAGVAAMLAYFALSYTRLRRRVADAEAAEGYYRSTGVDSPFILGFLHPRIYLPAAMAPEDVPHVLAHEQTHLRRRDHWVKPLSFLLLALYWFHPLLWLAYFLLCRDIEGACDETVLRRAEPEQRAAYSRALVACAAPTRRVAACPLAFGSSDVPGRVRRILSYRRPAFWLLLAAALGAVLIAVCLLSSPRSAEPGDPPVGLSMSAGQLDRLRVSDISNAQAVEKLLQKLGFGQYGDYTVRLERECPYAIFDYISPRNGPDGVVVAYQTEDLLDDTTELHYLSLLGVELIDNASWLQCVVETEEGTISLTELTMTSSPIGNRGEMSQREYLAALQEEIDRRLTLYRSQTLPWTPVEPDAPQDYDTYFAQTRLYDSGDLGRRGHNAANSGSAGYGASGCSYGTHDALARNAAVLEDADFLWVITREEGHLLLASDDRWVYFREGDQITRRDYWGGQRTVLWTDETGRLPGLSEEQCCKTVICEQTVLFYIAGFEDGYALYRLFLPTGQADVICPLEAEQVEEDGLRVYRPDSSREVILSGVRGQEEEWETYYLSCVQGREPQPVEPEDIN